MLWGRYSAKIDDKSRLRLPAKFRRDLPETEDDTFYVTSDDGQCAQIYPIPVWERVAQKFQEPPRMDPAKLKLQRFTSYYGLLTQMDPLEVWNDEVFRKSLKDSPLTLAERERLAEQGF